MSKKIASAANAVMSAMVQVAAAPIVKAVSKPAAKKVSAAASKPVAKKIKTQINYTVNGNGATALFAHTAAWLELSGLIYGGEAPAELIKEMGGTALAYHMRKGNFEVVQGMARLTVKGLAKFQGREEGVDGSQKFDPCDKEDYKLMMIHGVHDGRLLKNKAFIQPVKK